MASRSLTGAFVLMRNNALQNRHIFSEQSSDDHAALVSYSEAEKGLLRSKDSVVAPPWADKLEEVQYVMTKIRKKMRDLSTFHDKHVHRPTLDDNPAEEREIENITQDITQMFSYCQRIVHQIKSQPQGSTMQEIRVTQNVLTSLVTSLQDLSISFRNGQSEYLKQIRSREQRSNQFFDGPLLQNVEDRNGEKDMYINDYYDPSFNEEQLLLLEDNSQMVHQREKEIHHIVHSIVELNTIFKDLAHMVSDQGTVLDRIDYNIENIQCSVNQGLQQLQKAEHYQKKNTKMMCIMVMATTTVLLIILLLAFKT